MAQEPDETTRRVVKKVVKKTVVRPLPQNRPASASVPTNGQSAATASAAAPTRRLRTARLATPTRAQPARPVVAPAAPPPVATQSAAAPAPELRVSTPAPAAPDVEPADKPAKTRRRRPGLPTFGKPRLPKLPRPDVGGRLSRVRYAITDRIHDGAAHVGDRIADGWHWLIDLRLPHLSPVRGSAITGVLVGLLSVSLGWGFYQLFTLTRGTQAGGGWGFLALVFLAFVAFIAGELLLSGFGVPLPRVVSILSILLLLLLVLVFFIKLAAGMWAWLLIPALSAICFAASTTAMRVASQEKNDQRLPWEPTSESHVNLD